MYGHEEPPGRPSKTVKEKKQTSMYGNEDEKPQHRRQFEAQGMKSRIFEFQHDVIPIRLRPTAAQESMVFEFAFNPEITPPGQLKEPKQDVIYQDDRYSRIGSHNKDFNKAEKAEQEYYR